MVPDVTRFPGLLKPLTMTTSDDDSRRPDRRAFASSVVLHVVLLIAALVVHRMTETPIQFVAVAAEMVVLAEEETEEFSLPEPEDLVIETPDDPVPEQLDVEPEPEIVPDPLVEPPLPDPEPDPPDEEEEVEEDPPTEDPPAEEPPPETPPETESEDVASDDINVRMEGLRRDFPEYYAEIQAVVGRCLRTPPGVLGVTTVLRFEIQRDGSIPGRSISLHEPSGNSRFDIAAVGAVECAGSGLLSPLPEGFPVDALQVEFRFSPRGEQPE